MKLKGLAFHPFELAWEKAEEFVKNNPEYCIVPDLESGYPQIMTEEQRLDIEKLWDECKPKQTSNIDTSKIVFFGTGGCMEKGGKDFKDLFFNSENK